MADQMRKVGDDIFMTKNEKKVKRSQQTIIGHYYFTICEKMN